MALNLPFRLQYSMREKTLGAPRWRGRACAAAAPPHAIVRMWWALFSLVAAAAGYSDWMVLSEAVERVSTSASVAVARAGGMV